VSSGFNLKHRPRELRRRVVLNARMRVGQRWSNACILNISSRGLLVQASGIETGSTIELRRGEHVIVARVVWREGGKAGLRSEEPLAVDDILTVDRGNSLQLVASGGASMERRIVSRPRHEESRARRRLLQFVGTTAIGVGLSAVVLMMIGQAAARPLAMVKSALGPG
jgi:hypothetical protein